MQHPPNRLIEENSPYLRQHAHNPVDWYPWGEAALGKARRENKLLIVSIGYAACHWCHVMEHESFEDLEVSEVMNAHFVSVKVDREERPDIDQVYMDALMLMNGQGGWPLNVICLPDGRPIYGGTYFRKPHWISVLSQLARMWQERPDEGEKYAVRLTEGLARMDELAPVTEEDKPDREGLLKMTESLRKGFEAEYGGLGGAPKFPMPSVWQFLMQAGFLMQDDELWEMTAHTLERMAFGGIYDHVGGGFSRYSVDRRWHVPHFEKMLYDNGQLVSLYAEAWRRAPEPQFKRVVYETLDWVEREMTAPEGGFYSSLDADSEGVEGKFYVWTTPEIQAALEEKALLFMEFFGVTEAGNWEHGLNVLMQQASRVAFARRHEMSAEALDTFLEECCGRLLGIRGARPRPGLDDKILASWNGLMLSAYVDAYKSFGEARFLEAALRNGRFIRERMTDGARLWRNYKDGKAMINAFLDDYALVARAYLDLYEVSMEPEWLTAATSLVEYAIRHFHDPETGLFWYTSSEDPALIVRKYELRDNVIPSSNSLMAHVLLRIGRVSGRLEWEDMAARMLRTVAGDMERYAGSYTHWGLLGLRLRYPFYEIAVTGPESRNFMKQLGRIFLPNTLLAGASTEAAASVGILQDRYHPGQTRIFVCQNKACKLPVLNLKDTLQQLRFYG